MRLFVQMAVLLLLVVACDETKEQHFTLGTFYCQYLAREYVHVKYGSQQLVGHQSLRSRPGLRWETPEDRAKNYRRAATAMAKFLVSLKADTLALTEVGDRRDIAVLVEELAAAGETYPHYAVSDPGDARIRTCVAVLSKFRLDNVATGLGGTERFRADPEDPESEAVARLDRALRVEFDARGKRCLLFVVQLVRGEGVGKRQERRAQAALVRRHIIPVLNERACVIVAGNFAAHRGSPVLQRARGLEDVHEDLAQTGLGRYFDELERDTRWTYRRNGGRFQMDHILIGPAAESLCASGGIVARTVEHPNDPLISDHERALVATLRWKP